jgi:hypothetical protein
MPSIFEDYLAGLDTQGALYKPHGPGASADEIARNPQGQRRSGTGMFVKEGFAPSFTALAEGSEAAGALLRQGFEERTRARAAGFAGAQDELERGFGSQIASQGLSPDVASRMLLEQRAGGLQGLAAGRGEDAFGLAMEQAALAKGTASEFAGLNRDQFAQIVNYLMANKSLKANKQAALISGVSQGIGAAAGAGMA